MTPRMALVYPRSRHSIPSPHTTRLSKTGWTMFGGPPRRMLPRALTTTPKNVELLQQHRTLTTASPAIRTRPWIDLHMTTRLTTAGDPQQQYLHHRPLNHGHRTVVGTRQGWIFSLLAGISSTLMPSPPSRSPDLLLHRKKRRFTLHAIGESQALVLCWICNLQAGISNMPMPCRPNLSLEHPTRRKTQLCTLRAIAENQVWVHCLSTECIPTLGLPNRSCH